jgi:class 3 adenylate cyclase/tetratricopeptide (TPR) repeat protein
MERKLATVLFADLVGSTALVAGIDPEVARRRVTRFFDRVSTCIEVHGGTVEKFAGDAVMAAFGIPRAHEDDAERAVRAALAIRDSVHELGLDLRIGIEAGEVLADEVASTFATGEAVNLAARLQQSAEPNEILVGPGALRLLDSPVELEAAGERNLRGLETPVPTWRVLGLADGNRPARRMAGPFVGREYELELLQNTFERTVRDSRAHLFTVFGEPGIGKSRLAAEFLAGLEGATVLQGRCLPYGEGITYWPLAEMVKVAAGIADDDPVEEAYAKLRACCEDEAVADLIGLAVGVLEALEGQRSQQEIAWAAREWAEQLAAAQPLVLVFEDIHWAEEPLLELVEHLATWVRKGPLLVLCLARPELLDVYPGWGGGRVRATAIELEPLLRDEVEELVDALLDEPLPVALRAALLDKTEGNPLFLEETVRMLAEGDGDGRVVRIPDTLQALIAARIDNLPYAEKALVQRAAVIGRVFWDGALASLAPELDDLEDALESLEMREFVVRESRSTISGERAYRFKHVLIRDVAYAGLPKSARAHHHERFADWLRERGAEELLEIRAYHLDQATQLLAELDGAPPRELAAEAAAVLTAAGKRALGREANEAGRKLLLRAVELEPTLERRYSAAVAARRLADYPALASEMEEVLRQAREAGDGPREGRALYALAEAALVRDADVDRARELAEAALEAVPADDAPARFETLMVRGQVGAWTGELGDQQSFVQEALEVARAAGRKDMEARAALELAGVYVARLELDEAEPLVRRACELADQSGSIGARATALMTRARLASIRGDLDVAEESFEQARALFEEAGSAWSLGRTLLGLGWARWQKGELDRAERTFRDSIRILKPLEDRATLCESQRSLAQLLVQLGRLEEAERLALEARRTVGPQDHTSRATTRMALASVRVAQGKDAEAEDLLREALEIISATDFRYTKLEIMRALGALLRARGRLDEAAAFDAELAQLDGVVWGEPPRVPDPAATPA